METVPVGIILDGYVPNEKAGAVKTSTIILMKTFTHDLFLSNQYISSPPFLRLLFLDSDYLIKSLCPEHPLLYSKSQGGF